MDIGSLVFQLGVPTISPYIPHAPPRKSAPETGTSLHDRHHAHHSPAVAGEVLTSISKGM